MYVGFFLNQLLTISMYQTEYYCRKYKMSDFAYFAEPSLLMKTMLVLLQYL